MDYEEKIKKVVELLRTSNKTLALTGAGISTESGIPDYRSPGTGLWQKEDPMEVASASAFNRDPAAYYRRALERWKKWMDAEPNAAHYALARLEKMGYLQGVITQNVDGLHKKAGSVNLWEVHGHMRLCYCVSCSRRYPFDDLLAQYYGGINPPRCKGCGGILRPYFVLFGDEMNEEYYQAVEALHGCRLLLAAGSSLLVYPVAGLPRLAEQLVIINREPTPWDSKATVVINESTGKVFTDILFELEKQVGPMK